MTELAKAYLGFQATSLETERVFSDMGNLIHKKRTRLRPDIIDALLFLKLNLRYGTIITEGWLQE